MQSLTGKSSVVQLTTIGMALSLAWVVVNAVWSWIRVYWKPFLNLPGPPADTYLQGSLGQLTADAGPTGKVTEKWFDSYGSTMLLRSSRLRPQILTRDVSLIRAVSHSPRGYKSPVALATIRALHLDNSLIASENDEHRRQRKILSPLFSTTSMRRLWPHMVAKCSVVGKWLEAKSKEGSFSTSAKDIIKPLSVGLISKCLFGEDRDVIQGAEMKDYEKVMFTPRPTRPSWLDMIGFEGFFKNYPMSERQKGQAQLAAGLRAVSRDLLGRRAAEKKKEDFGDSNILSMLLGATWATDVPETKLLSERQLEDNLPMFFLAGHSTVVETLEWALHYVAVYPDVQSKLRQEIDGVEDDADFDTVNQLPFLDAFLREVLRCHPIAAILQREALDTFTIPLSEPVRGRDGRMMDTVTVDKGTTILWSAWDVNLRSEAYGEDFREFRPDRHFEGEHNSGLGAVWGNLATFSGGDHACIGFRFAIAEIKAVIFVLLRSLEISEPEGQKVTYHGMIYSKKTVSESKDGEMTQGVPITVRLRGTS